VVRDPDGTFHVAGVTQKSDPPPTRYPIASVDMHTVVQDTQTRPPLTDGTVDTRATSALSLYVSKRSADGSLSTSQVAYREGAIMFPANCSAELGAGFSGTARGAVSANGTKIFFSAFGSGSCATPAYHRMWAKVGEAEPIDLSASQCDDGECGAPAVVLFEGAARDGSRVFFKTEQKLVDGDQDTTKKMDLYEYDFSATGDKLRPITAGLEPEGAGFVRATRISDDGTHVYFVADGRPLAGENARGETPVAGNQNLYVYRRGVGQETGSITFIAALDPAADSALWSGGSKPAQTTPDGRFLLFGSPSDLTGEKLAGDTLPDIYRYDSRNDELRRIWTTDPAHNGTERSAGANMATIPEATGSYGGMQKYWTAVRMISNDGRTIAFDTSEPLSPWDANHVSDVYLWRADTGRFTMLTDGRADAVTGFNSNSVTGYSTMSPSGDSVFFVSYSPLVASHTSGQSAVFVARSDGGLLERGAPAECVGEACQGSGSQPPASAAPGSETNRGTGNAVRPAESAPKLRVANWKPVRGTTPRLRVTVP
jgi:Tol biopolymer transport system component